MLTESVGQEPSISTAEIRALLGKVETSYKQQVFGHRTLIVVDDEPDNISSAVMILRCLGFKVVVAESFGAALEAIDRIDDPSQEVAGLFVDCHLITKRDGVRLIEELRGDECLSHLPLIPYTRFGMDYADRLEALDLHPIDSQHPLWLMKAVGDLYSKLSDTRFATNDDPLVEFLRRVVCEDRRIRDLQIKEYHQQIMDKVERYEEMFGNIDDSKKMTQYKSEQATPTQKHL